MTNESERRLILEMVERGKITAEEALRLLNTLPQEEEASVLESGDESESAADFASGEPAELEDLSQLSATLASAGAGAEEHTSSSQRFPAAPNMEKYRSWWMIPLWVGIAITVLAAIWMYQALQSAGYGFWFYCAWLPFLIGLGVMALAWASRTARWLHLRLYEQDGAKTNKFAISFPIPIRPAAWFLRTFRSRIRGLENASVDQILAALESTTNPQNPLYIEVDEEDGEHVEIYIG